MLFIHPILPFRRLCPHALWRGDRAARCVYLTFDDGPIPEVTPWVLDTLDRYGVKATFFVVGDWVEKYPESVKALNIAAAEVAEYKVKEGSLITKNPVKLLGLPAYANIGGYVRNGKGHFVNGDTVFEAGDIVVVFCLEGYLKKLERFFK